MCATGRCADAGLSQRLLLQERGEARLEQGLTLAQIARGGGRRACVLRRCRSDGVRLFGALALDVGESDLDAVVNFLQALLEPLGRLLVRRREASVRRVRRLDERWQPSVVAGVNLPCLSLQVRDPGQETRERRGTL